MAEFNSYLLGKARKSVGNLTIVYAKGKNIVRAKVFGRKDNPTPEVLVQRMKVRLLGKFARRILLTEFTVSPGGRFTAYYNDDDMFWGHAVEVSGSLKKGITYANLAG